MAAPCASLGSLLTYLPPARPPPLPSCNSRPPLPLVAFVRHHRFLRIRIRALFSSQKGSIVPCSLHGGERERKKGRESKRKACDGEKNKKEMETPEEALLGATIGAKSVPSGCLHQFYRRFLNPAVRTDSAHPRLDYVV